MGRTRTSWARVRGVTALACVFSALLAVAAPAPAEGAGPAPVGLVVDGQLQRLPAPAFVREGIAFVPAEDLVRALGGQASWDPAAGVLRGFVGRRAVLYRLGETAVTVGERRVSLPAGPEVLGDRLYLPLRPLAVALGYRVTWDGVLGVVSVGRGLSGTLPAARVAVNDRAFAKQVSPVVVEGGLLFPARQLLESLGYEVTWNAATGEVWFRRHGVRGAFRPGERSLTVNGRLVPLDAAATLREGRAYVPLSLLEAAGEEVSWHPAAWAVVARRESFGPAAFLAALSGRVEILRRGAPAAEPAALGARLSPGDRLVVGEGSGAEVRLDDGSLLQVGAGSTLEVGELDVHADTSRHVSFRLLVGRVVARVVKLIQRNSRFEIETPTGVAGVRGTAFLVEADPQRRSLVAVFSGAVQVAPKEAAGSGAVVVLPNQETRLGVGDEAPSPPATLRQVRVDRWLRAAVKKALVEEAEDLLAPGRERGSAGAGEAEEGGPLPPPERLLEEVKAELGDLRQALPEEEGGPADGERDGHRRHPEDGSGGMTEREPGDARQEAGRERKPGVGEEGQERDGAPGSGETGDDRGTKDEAADEQPQPPKEEGSPPPSAEEPGTPPPGAEEPEQDPTLVWDYPDTSEGDGSDEEDGEGKREEGDRDEKSD